MELKVGQVVVLKVKGSSNRRIILEVLEVNKECLVHPYKVFIIEDEDKISSFEETTLMWNIEKLKSSFKIQVLPNAEVAKILFLKNKAINE